MTFLYFLLQASVNSFNYFKVVLDVISGCCQNHTTFNSVINPQPSRGTLINRTGWQKTDIYHWHYQFLHRPIAKYFIVTQYYLICAEVRTIDGRPGPDGIVQRIVIQHLLACFPT